MIRICITFGGKPHCFYLPVLQFPVTFPHPGPGPVNYPQLIQDGILVSSIQGA
jgi:hypothetical protein